MLPGHVQRPVQEGLGAFMCPWLGSLAKPPGRFKMMLPTLELGGWEALDL